MKKLSLLLCALAMTAIVSCKENEEAPVEEATSTEIQVEAPAPAESNDESEGTKINVGSDGVKYSDDKTEIEVSKDGGKVKKD